MGYKILAYEDAGIEETNSHLAVPKNMEIEIYASWNSLLISTKTRKLTIASAFQLNKSSHHNANEHFA